MNILIIGLGSIGQRHLRNLKIIEPNQIFMQLEAKEETYSLLNNFNKVIKGDIKKIFIKLF